MTHTALVLGATGLIGTELVTRLSAAQHIKEVIALTRRPIQYTESKVSNDVIDFEHLADYHRWGEVDLLFSCLGTTLKQAGSIAAQRRVDLDYQFTAAELAANAGTLHYLLVSSSGASSKSLSPYLRMKGELEDRVLALPFSHISIFRPSLLLGDRGSTRFAEELASTVMPIVCKLPGLSRYRPIHGWQVAEKMVDVSSQTSKAYQSFTLDEVFPSED